MKEFLKNWFIPSSAIFLTLTVLISSSFATAATSTQEITAQTVSQELAGKSAGDKAQIKSHEISKIGAITKTKNTRYGVDIEVVSISEMTRGVEVLVKAWDANGRQYGFGSNGKIETERVRIINPPILIPDGTTTTVEWVDPVTGDSYTHPKDNFKEDLPGALLESLAQTIRLIGKDGKDIIKGTVGHTTTVVYPDADPETTSADGYTVHNTGLDTNGISWASLTAAAGTDGRANNAEDTAMGIRSAIGSTWRYIARGVFLFDTSSIPDNDTIFSATLSLYGSDKQDNLSISPNINIYSSNPATTTDVVAGDFDSLGSTDFSTPISYTNFSTSSYNNFPLNSSGIGSITKTNISKFGTRNSNYDALGIEPTWSSAVLSFMNVWQAETSGTTEDPKLTISHTATTGYTTVVSDIDYAPTGKISYIQYGSGVNTTYTYDATKLYRLTNILTVKP